MKKIIAISAISTLLSACSFNPNPPLEFLPYQEIDGKVEKIRFMQTISSDNDDIKGTAYQQVFFSDLPTSKEIGNIYHIYDSNGQPMNTIFLMDKKASLNPKSDEQMKALANAKEFDFYEFGKGRIAHAQFSAKKSICQDFKSKNGIKFTMATSYYLNPKQQDDFYASLISANLKSNLEVVNFNYRPIYQIGDKALLNAVEKEEKSNGEDMARRNLKEKYSLLTNLVCTTK